MSLRSNLRIAGWRLLQRMVELHGVRDRCVRRFLRALTLAGALLPAGCGGSGGNVTRSIPEAIIGGMPIQAGAWPSVVLIDNGCTGLLLAPDLVVFAAHCGTRAQRVWVGDTFSTKLDPVLRVVTIEASNSVSSVAIERCEAYPDWQLGNGTDLAFCTLVAPALPASQVVRAASGCLVAQVVPGAAATLVGFGLDADSGAFGIKRSADAPLGQVGVEIQIGTSSIGTCAGDSGSPAFVRLNSGKGVEWGAIGVLSSGNSEERCGAGYYTPLAPRVDWLARESRREVVPCFDADGQWSASPACLRPTLDAHGVPAQDASNVSEYSNACGPAYDETTSLVPAGGCTLVREPNHRSGSWFCVAVALFGLGVRRRRTDARQTKRCGGRSRASLDW